MIITATNGGSFQIDEEDAGSVGQFKWRMHMSPKNKTPHVRTAIYLGGRKYQTVRLHHFLIGRPLHGMVTDHINGDPSDNRRNNLRVATASENCQNRGLSSLNALGLRGVSRHARKYRARIRVGGRLIGLGSFATSDQAFAARLAAEHHHFGAFAPSICRRTA